MEQTQKTTTLTGSRAWDLVAFSVLISVMVLLGPRLLVYYRGTPVRVALTAIHADGTRRILETPRGFEEFQPGIHWAERKIREFDATKLVRDLAPFEDQLEWSLYLSQGAPTTEAVRVILTRRPDGD